MGGESDYAYKQAIRTNLGIAIRSVLIYIYKESFFIGEKLNWEVNNINEKLNSCIKCISRQCQNFVHTTAVSVLSSSILYLIVSGYSLLLFISLPLRCNSSEIFSISKSLMHFVEKKKRSKRFTTSSISVERWSKN